MSNFARKTSRSHAAAFTKTPLFKYAATYTVLVPVRTLGAMLMWVDEGKYQLKTALSRTKNNSDNQSEE